jgi:hypothetical protein
MLEQVLSLLLNPSSRRVKRNAGVVLVRHYTGMWDTRREQISQPVGTGLSRDTRLLMGPSLVRVIRVISGVHAVDGDDTYISTVNTNSTVAPKGLGSWHLLEQCVLRIGNQLKVRT